MAIRSPYNLGMLEKCLAETDPETTEVVVMTAHGAAARLGATMKPTITDEDRQLADGRGQPGRARGQAGQAGDRADQRAVLRHDPDRQDDRRPGADHGAVEQVPPRRPARPVALYWLNVCGAKPEPLSIRVLGKDRDVRLDIAGGSQIPKPGRSGSRVGQVCWPSLRKSWHGVERLLLAYDGSPLSAPTSSTPSMSFLDPAIAGHPDRRRRGGS